MNATNMLYLFGTTVVFLLTSRVFASHCYSDICHNRTTELSDSGPRCLVTSIQRGKDCVNLRFENLGLASRLDESLGSFRLSAYVKDFGHFRGRTTAFNLTIGDAKFRRLIIRYQDSTDDRNAACREIEIDGVAREDSSFPELYVACPFAEETFEGTPYRLEYLAVGANFEYSRKLVFVVPRHASMDKDTKDVTAYTPFFYIDVSNIAILRLHVQPLPTEFNVTRYRVWLINNDTNVAVSLEINFKDNDDAGEIRHNFSVGEGVHYLKVTAMHPLCGEYGCVNGTSPAISTKQPVRRLLIMIISVVWIPPVVMYAMYRSYKFYKKNVLDKRVDRPISCLLVYSPTHNAHVDVMKKLALYMRRCGIDAMIDILDIPETTNKDPGIWCNAAFLRADVIVVASSPISSSGVPSSSVIYQNIDNHALRLLKENYSRRDKRYFSVHFPYCKISELPEEARLFGRFEMPRDLNKLVRNIYAVDRVRFYGLSDKELTEAIGVAGAEIPRGKCAEKDPLEEDHDTDQRSSEATLSLKTTGPDMTKLERKNDSGATKDIPTGVIDRYFTTNIDELNLLGDNEGDEDETFITGMPKDDDEFRIDRLNL